AQLAAEFRPVAEKAAAARRASEARSVAENGDIKAKLLSMADSIVQVRRVDAPPASGGRPAGENPVEKVQAALDRGALQDAVTAFEGLPQEAKAEAGPFGEKLKARNAAAQAARALLSDAFKTLPAGP
ncbi:translation initiation factor 2, partial [Methylobacterium hispanicum]